MAGVARRSKRYSAKAMRARWDQRPSRHCAGRTATWLTIALLSTACCLLGVRALGRRGIDAPSAESKDRASSAGARPQANTPVGASEAFLVRPPAPTEVALEADARVEQPAPAVAPEPAPIGLEESAQAASQPLDAFEQKYFERDLGELERALGELERLTDAADRARVEREADWLEARLEALRAARNER